MRHAFLSFTFAIPPNPADFYQFPEVHAGLKICNPVKDVIFLIIIDILFRGARKINSETIWNSFSSFSGCAPILTLQLMDIKSLFFVK